MRTSAQLARAAVRYWPNAGRRSAATGLAGSGHDAPRAPLVPTPGCGARRSAVGHAILIAGLSAACILLPGCRKRSTSVQESAGSPRLVKIQELTEAERRYGHAARRSAKVTYQPDVVILPAGADAIRCANPDGLTWIIDPDAEGADDIRPCKVLLLTSRAAGLVLGVRKEGDGLQVVLGPVEITEVVRDGDFTLNQPVDLSQALTYTVPEMFDPVMPVAIQSLPAPEAGPPSRSRGSPPARHRRVRACP